MTDPELAVINGITWERQEPDTPEGGEIWRLVWPVRWSYVLKDYGKHDLAEDDTNYSFSGIRLVGGGPIRSAGRWTNMDRAMADVTGYLHDLALKEEVTMRAQAGRIADWRAEVQVPRKQRKVAK